MSVHDDMDLYITADHFIVAPYGKPERLLIPRNPAQPIRVEEVKPSNAERSDRRICGILGSVLLLDGPHLIVATHRIFVGVLNGQPIWQLAGYDLLPFGGQRLSDDDRAQNDVYAQMVRQVLDTPFFYFAYAYDLTHSLQRAHGLSRDAGATLAGRADARFTWNATLLRTLCPDYANTLGAFALPLVHGFVSVHAVQANAHQFTWALVSRRSVQRAGTRLFTRGIDEQGHCANYVETEQIVEYAGERVSFVQTRGSIPLFWSQAPNLKYKPRPTLAIGRDHATAAGRHLDEQLRLYGRQVLVNLIDHKGSELALETQFGQLIAQLANPNVRYESFDFHAECRKMRWDRLSILIDRLAHEQDEFGHFHARRDGSVALQDGVFRTNCIDCLDRTNVVQSMLAKRALQQALVKLGVLRPEQTVDETHGLRDLYKNVWADNADLVSTQYSGTGALKTDFTRTGKRTKQGALMDGWNSAVRYVKNNFRDGRRQDAIDLFLGNCGDLKTANWKVREQKRDWKQTMLPPVLLFASVMFLSSAVLPREYNTENLLFMMFWGAIVAGSIRVIFKHGTEFVDAPRLTDVPANRAPDA